MQSKLDEAHQAVVDLVRGFELHAAKYLSPSYQEAEVRKDFIDPFFVALGWDVNHREQKNPWEQEVKVERAVDVALTQKKADYAFYLGPNFRDVRFYVEAKKPSIDLTKSIDAHFQTIRYGWSAGTPLAVLTDFEQILVLDCRRKPHPETVLEQCHLRLSYKQLLDPEEFAKFYWIFSREALETGAFDRYVAALPKPKGGAKQRKLFGGGYQSVDESFLNELESHRERLAKMYKKADQSLDSSTLTEITQRTLDRLVFLRFLEDKLIEPTLRVADLGKRRDCWLDFLEASRVLDATYNGIVFKPHPYLDRVGFNVDPDEFAEVCEQLSHLNSPYDFNAIPIHILGSIYERFLGKVIVATEKRVRVEEKPEVRKAGGVYYTPEYVVRHIVEQTVGSLVAGREPKDVWTMRFADIACGSGSFLLGVFDYLLRYLERWYNESVDTAQERADRDAKALNHGCVKDDSGVWRLGLKLRRQVLVRCIFGVDIDRQAVEVSQLSLFLKLLENESTASARQFMMDLGGGKKTKLLPDLTGNVQCGNSLVDWRMVSAMDQAELRELNPFDFDDGFSLKSTGGFDAIVGNPPYEVVEKERGEASWPHDLFVKAIESSAPYADATGGKLNLFRFFIVRAIRLLRPGGRFGMIVPLSILGDISCAQTRKFMLSQLASMRADCFPQKDNANRRIFREAKLSTVIASGERRLAPCPSVDGAVRVLIYPGNRFEELERDCTVTGRDAALIDAKGCPIPLVDNAQLQLLRKLHTSANVKQLKDVSWAEVTRGEINQTTYRKFITSNPEHFRLLKGVEIRRFGLKEKLSQGSREWFDERSFLKAFPGRKTKGHDRIATQRITGVDEKLRVVAALIAGPAYFADSTNSIFVSEGGAPRNLYLLGLLNSRLMQWRFRLTSTNNNVGTNELDALPIPLPLLSEAAGRASYEEFVRLVGELSDALADEAGGARQIGAELARRKAVSLERRVDEMVYSFFDLSTDEIALIERQTGAPPAWTEPAGAKVGQLVED
jgi:Alw26I/Eco31I/Esp3I family type II restriction m6 adenine DNA methyltransferase